ncbi:EAL domain-containing protein [Massilia sp. Bi118]|uniref:GGDEF/EAL domain-containing response regulator n=1 Tax=Massilia sp. Bi118 TaxID=2822346 RepID=UPI001E3BB340|nr:EAL domain-containing protein [Massilia sp. Bi118]
MDILVVEDSPTQAQHLARLLASEPGWHVRIAGDGASALAEVARQRPHLIISDIAMPGMDGFTLCRTLKDDPVHASLPVVLLTRLASLNDIVQALESGADSFVRKPYDGIQLRERLQRILQACALGTSDRPLEFMAAERRQIYDLLVATHAQALRMNAELADQRCVLERSCRSLAILHGMAAALNEAVGEQAVAEAALAHLLALPGLAGAAVCALGPDGIQRSLAARGMPAASTGLQLLRLPLLAQQREVGVLELLPAGPVLGESERSLLDSAATQLGSALERAGLYACMEALVVERTAALRSERNRLSAVVDTAGALVLLAAPSGHIVMFNRACEEALGWKAAEAIGQPCWEVVRRVDDELAVRHVFQNLEGMPRTARMQGEWHTRKGGPRSIIWTQTLLRRDDGSIEYVLGTGIDATELRGAEERLRYISNFDTLTGLPNRLLLRDRLRQMKVQAQGEGQVLGFMLLGLGRMALIREALGPAAEQALVQEAAARLRAIAGADAVGRFSDGSFAVLAMRPVAEDLAVAARRLLAAVGKPYAWESEELHLDPALGIAVFPNDGLHYDVMVQGAEAALRQSLESVGQRYAFYRPELNQGANDRFKLESALRRAIEREELVLHYQPQVDLASGAIVGAEALLRWRHPERGLVPPGVFIPLAEETGLIMTMGDWVLRTACSQQRKWRDAGLPLVPVSVNLSAHQFDDQIVGTVGRVLEESGIEAELLELELTESASMADADKSVALLAQLKSMGVKLSIDDFGTGFSNLNYLKRFPVDKLKLDQSFVADILGSGDDLAIARAVIAMAHGLRLTVVAEGVEEAGQLALLAEHGCDAMQGYYFSKPLPAEDFGKMLRDGVMLDRAPLREPQTAPA